MTTARDVAAKFENAKPAGKGSYMAKCPAHEDNKASLSISDGDKGGVVLHCHVGCDPSTVLEKVGLTLGDLMPPRPEKRRLVAAYDYCDEGGELLYQAVRYDPKGFLQRRPDGNGGWIFKLGNTRRVLYRLAELTAADLQLSVFIPEGEKDVDRLRGIGLIATCNVGGASASPRKSKWLPDYNESLRGRHVVVLPDNDEPGRTHAVAIYKQLQGVATSVVILELPGLPEKGDVSDWINAGGTSADLTAMAENCPLPAWVNDESNPPPKQPKMKVSVDKTPATPAKTGVLSTLALYQPFPVEAFPGRVGEFIIGTANAINVDAVMVAMPVLAVVAGAIGATRYVLPKRGYSEPSVIWGAIIAESGSKKSPALDAPCKPVIQQELQNIAEFDKKKLVYDASIVNYKAELTEWQKKGRKSGEPPPAEPEAPICKRFIVSDITIEALGPKLKDNPRGLLSKHDELSGFFSAMNQYRSGGKGADEAKYLSMFGARELIIDRKGGGTLVVPRAAVSIIGTVQPGILKRILTREHFESGMSARFLLAYPPQRVALWSEDEVNQKLEWAFGDTIQKLQRLNFVEDEDGQLVPGYCPFTATAKERFIEFYNQNAEEGAALNGDLSAVWSKLTGYAARFALILQFARWAQSDDPTEPTSIDLQAMEAGIKLSQWFANEIRRVYAVFAETEEQREARETLELIHRKGGIVSARDLVRASRKFETTEHATAVLTKLVSSEYGTWQESIISSSSSVGGRPRDPRFTLLSAVDKTPVSPVKRDVLSAQEGRNA